MNRTIIFLMISDIFVITGFGLMAPIMAIFIKENLVGGTILAAGIASTIFLITKCIVQLPFSKYVDDHNNKIKWLIVGTFLIAFVPFLYIYAAKTNVYTLFLAQVVYGIGSGLAYPTWVGLWTLHLDKKHESFEWSFYSTLTGFGTAAAATIGASIAQFIGFSYTFAVVGILSLIGCFILFGLEKRRGKYLSTYAKLKLLGKNHHHYH